MGLRAGKVGDPMAKLVTLFMASALVLAASAPASAVEVKLDGNYQFVFQTGEGDFTGINADDMQSRVRLGLTFSVSEDLSGYFQTETRWGWGTRNRHKGADLDVVMRQAYIDWRPPGTDVKLRMGRQSVSLPSFASTGVHISDLVADGVAVHTPLGDGVSLSAFWLRPARAEDDSPHARTYDLFGLTGTAASGSWSVSPWAVYGSKAAGLEADAQGNISAGPHADILTFGGGLKWRPFNPVTLALDAGWGRAAYSGRSDQQGWFAVARAAYALKFAEPALLGWYASGDGRGALKNSGQFPVIFGDFNASSTFFDNTWGPGAGNGIHNTVIGGTWGLGVQLNGISFLSGLTHDLGVVYVGGTNSRYNGGCGAPNAYSSYLTSEDSLVEFNLLNTWEIYKNLTSRLELAYVVENFDTDTAHGRGGEHYENAWRVTLHFQYLF